MPDGAATAHLYRPKLLTVLREGYGFAGLRRDAGAGLTVAVVALPLSMAIAIASGVSPDRGLYAAIVGGFLVSALGGSRYQIGGPAGAFIVLMATTVARFGLDGLLLAVLMSGAMLVVLGLLRLGALIRHIPDAVTVGFTAAIAATIVASQLANLGGLRLVSEPGPFGPKLMALAAAAPSLNPAALAVGLAVAVLILGLRRLAPRWPGMLIAVALATVVAALLRLPVETIGMRFGAIAHGLPAPSLPTLSVARALELMPSALAFTLLGGIESLLSAKVADAMTARRHRSNMELVAQGVANMVSAVFGGLSVTGTIARTATNVRAGAVSPVSGMLHAVFLLLILRVAAPLAGFVPLSALAGVLLVVSWNMLDVGEGAKLLRRPDTALVLATTFLGTLVTDLGRGVLMGCVVAAVIAGLHRFRRRAT